jgi:hypothetical protein
LLSSRRKQEVWKRVSSLLSFFFFTSFVFFRSFLPPFYFSTCSLYHHCSSESQSPRLSSLYCVSPGSRLGELLDTSPRRKTTTTKTTTTTTSPMMLFLCPAPSNSSNPLSYPRCPLFSSSPRSPRAPRRARRRASTCSPRPEPQRRRSRSRAAGARPRARRRPRLVTTRPSRASPGR